MHPRAQCRKIAVVLVPAGMELCLRAVVAVGGPHRAYYGEPIHISADMGKPITDLDPTVAVLPKTYLRRVKRFVLMAVCIGNTRPLDGQFFRIQDVTKRGLRDCLAAIFGEHRL